MYSLLSAKRTEKSLTHGLEDILEIKCPEERNQSIVCLHLRKEKHLFSVSHLKGKKIFSEQILMP